MPTPTWRRIAVERGKQKDTRTGRPSSLDAQSRRRVLDALASGTTVPEVARATNTSRQTIMRIRARGSG
ncbi:helix-turn-helix domain-containing protein [Caballeronia arvi]|uniref:helix-turn-helix domain-containing protein n=1 Tax=Caballeronia arvi TaxID=1777135 RepID=UPI002E12A86F|nr:helix-turn-helix domain-containing protein [Caballeronia arvi]